MKTLRYNQSVQGPDKDLTKPILGQNYRRVEPISLLFVVNNEEETIEETIISFVNEISKEIPLHIVVTEDGSTDKTKEILLELRKKIPMELVTGKDKKGYMDATKDGLMSTNSKWVFITDSDGQFIPSDFWKLKREGESCDLIIGWKKNRADSPYRILLSKTFHLLVRALFGLPIHDPNTAFRVVKKKLLNNITRETKYLKYSFWTEFTIRAYRRGYNVTETPINHRKRQNGKSHIYNIRRIPHMLISQMMGLFKLWKELRKQ